ASVEKRRPEAAAAFHALPSRCLAALACLTRSKDVRAKARADEALIAAASQLSEVVPEVEVMLQAIRMLDDASLLVLAPSHGLGWHVAVDEVPSNLELSLLLADAVVTSAKPSQRSALPFKRLDPKVVAIVKGGPPPKRPPSVRLPFALVGWTAVT